MQLGVFYMCFEYLRANFGFGSGWSLDFGSDKLIAVIFYNEIDKYIKI